MYHGWNSVNFFFEGGHLSDSVKIHSLKYPCRSSPHLYLKPSRTLDWHGHFELHGFRPDILHLPFFLCLCKLKMTSYSISLSISVSLPPSLSLLLCVFKCAIVKIWPQKEWFYFPCGLCVWGKLPFLNHKRISSFFLYSSWQDIKVHSRPFALWSTLSFRQRYQPYLILHAAVFISTINNMFHILSKIIYSYYGSEFI